MLSRVPSLTSRRAQALLAVLVLVSAVVRAAAAHAIPGPFIAPDEMVYSLLGRSLWADGRLSILGADTGYYSFLYPAYAGLPLSVGELATGFRMLQVVQALVVSLTAVVVYAWGRAFLSQGWALAAAALSLTPPALAYAGLAMTESLFLPLATLAAWATARAVERPTLGRQALVGVAIAAAVATRLQGVVLVPVAVSAVLLDAGFARGASRLRRWLPGGLALAALAAVWLAWRATAGSWGSVFGAYEAAVSGYDASEAAKFVTWHVADVFLLCLGIPLLALGALSVEAVARRLDGPAERAFVAVALPFAVWLAVQVGVFSSQFVGRLAERDLVAVLPPLLLALALWLQRGAPRPQPWTALLALGLAIPAALLPIERFATLEAAPDAFMTIPLEDAVERWGADTLGTLWVLGVAAAVAAFVLVPRRLAPLLAVGVGVLLAGSSLVASREVGRVAQDARHRFFGDADRSWIDEHADGPVTLLVDGSAYWPSVWHQAFWNERVTDVVHLPDAAVPGPLPQRTVSPRFDGLLFDTAGHPVESPRIVAPTPFAFDAKRLAAVEQHDIDRAGLALWRAASPPRLSTWTTDVLPNGDFSHARVVVYACPKGRLELTLIPKAGRAVELFADGRPVGRAELSGEYWNGIISTPPNADGRGSCTFDVQADGLVGSTRLAFAAN
jgi:4-amino-4-deoxy-L-arabinose transferase-like glycosyltransferase